jgi:transcriptional regulator with XRE-family HTH domain
MLDKNSAHAFLKEMGIEITQADREYGKIISRVSTELLIYRHDNHLTQKQLAEKLGFNQPYLSKIENGEKNLSIKKLAEISASLGAKVEISLGLIDIESQKKLTYSDDTEKKQHFWFTEPTEEMVIDTNKKVRKFESASKLSEKITNSEEESLAA